MPRAKTSIKAAVHGAAADRGQDVLTYYASLPGMDTEQQSLLTDLLADLMHAATANRNLRFQRALDSAEAHYTAERNGED